MTGYVLPLTPTIVGTYTDQSGLARQVAPGKRHTSASAQMPVARAIVSDEVAKVTLMKWQINYVVARQVVDATIECALKWPTGPSHLAVFVLSPTGDVVAAQVMDGVAPIGVEAAELKAKTVLYARTTSRAVMERFNSVDTRVYRTDLGRDQGLAYYFSAGGIPIVLENQLIGVIGVGGGNGEEPCASLPTRRCSASIHPTR
ncbi:MAG: heme-binding protein [Acidobacteria bacterium]|nr:heme-binding protein [Acidobacteriota bacterium]